jgi:transcriptional regulator with XRE-family HTH domain
MLQTIRLWWSGTGEPLGPTGEIAVLDRFDVSYRIRRLQFVVRRVNQHESVTSLDVCCQDILDRFKLDTYGFLDRLFELRKARGLTGELIARLAAAAQRLPLDRTEALDLMEQLAGALDLAAVDREFDGLLNGIYTELAAAGEASFCRSLLADYLGFPLYDVLLLTNENEQGGPDPLTPVRVERISPSDALTLADAFDRLKCRDYMGFLGFFNRSYREHDYLWGRLHAADRIMDLLAPFADPDDDLSAERKALFEAILRRERPRLHECAPTLMAVTERVRAL